MLSKTYLQIAQATNKVALFFGAAPFKFTKTKNKLVISTNKKLIFRFKFRTITTFLYTLFLGVQAYLHRKDLVALNFAIIFTYLGLGLSLSYSFLLIDPQRYCDVVNIWYHFLAKRMSKWARFYFKFWRNQFGKSEIGKITLAKVKLANGR